MRRLSFAIVLAGLILMGAQAGAQQPASPSSAPSESTPIEPPSFQSDVSIEPSTPLQSPDLSDAGHAAGTDSSGVGDSTPMHPTNGSYCEHHSRGEVLSNPSYIAGVSGTYCLYASGWRLSH